MKMKNVPNKKEMKKNAIVEKWWSMYPRFKRHKTTFKVQALYMNLISQKSSSFFFC